MKGRHIAFEGIDGSGLTTHSKLLTNKLLQKGIRAWYSKEPTEGPIGRLIRAFLLEYSEPPHEMLALLFAADRYWNYYSSPKPLIELLNQGYIVISDRYKYSSIAYQGAFAGIEWVWNINSRVPHSDIIVYVDVPVDVAIKRVLDRASRGEANREAYEKRKYLEQVKEAYEKVLEFAEKDGVSVLRVSEVYNGVERPINEVNNEIYGKLMRLIGFI